MINYEQKLKNLIEDMGSDLTRKYVRAELTTKIYERAYSGITYDEAMLLVAEQNKILEHMPPTDMAFEHIVTERDNLLKWAGAYNDLNTLGRHDHELPVHALVSVGDIAVECKFHIPQLHYRDHDRSKIILSTLREKISSSSEWRGGFRNMPKIDFVEL